MEIWSSLCEFYGEFSAMQACPHVEKSDTSDAKVVFLYKSSDSVRQVLEFCRRLEGFLSPLDDVPINDLAFRSCFWRFLI